MKTSAGGEISATLRPSYGMYHCACKSRQSFCWAYNVRGRKADDVPSKDAGKVVCDASAITGMVWFQSLWQLCREGVGRIASRKEMQSSLLSARAAECGMVQFGLGGGAGHGSIDSVDILR